MQLPGEAYRHKVLAEAAVQDKEFLPAADHHRAALDIYPTWPEGQFNLALLSGELKNYAAAVTHMQLYLRLVPNASDAQAAKDKIIIWQDKLGQAADPLSQSGAKR